MWTKFSRRQWLLTIRRPFQPHSDQVEPKEETPPFSDKVDEVPGPEIFPQ